jgi:hypothetical protein
LSIITTTTTYYTTTYFWKKWRAKLPNLRNGLPAGSGLADDKLPPPRKIAPEVEDLFSCVAYNFAGD